MFVLDDSMVSSEVLDYLETSHHPVLDNEAARQLEQSGAGLAIATTDPCPQKRVIALSEAQLDRAKPWCSESTQRGIALLKDKAGFRRALAPLFPDYLFREYPASQLDAVDPETLTYPAVLKPSTGFFSLGIYPLFSADDWRSAVQDIRGTSDSWNDVYDSSVVSDADFLVEGYLQGDEYAIDAYFDSEGRAVVLDILKHDFASADDVSDRLYYTSKRVIETQLEPMTRFLDDCNGILGLSDFPVHAEVRVDGGGRIIPIEFNPLRFAGLCTTDLSYFAYGFKTYQMFLDDKRPNWNQVLAGKDGLSYTMMLLTTSPEIVQKSGSFDYDALRARFRRVMELRQTDIAKMGTYGFLFTETRDEDWTAEAEGMLHTDLSEFLS